LPKLRDFYKESAGTRHISVVQLKQQVLVRQPAVLPIHKDFLHHVTG